MSQEKKMIRNSFVTKLAAIAAGASILLVGCATKSDGDGSESHFLCTTDSDCVSQGSGYRCVDQTCVSSVGQGAGGGLMCPDLHSYPFDGAPPERTRPGSVDGGVYGCYPPRNPAPSGWFPAEPPPACSGTSESCGAYAPTALPCGACSASQVCAMNVAAVCDCGYGPFVDVYDDQWVCRCVSGQWDCRLTAPSGASCTACAICAEETRSTPYSPGVVFTGSAGTTVSLTSTPAPPSLGDNTWTFGVSDSGGVGVPGATITATQKMVDHQHPGTKAIVVTDLSGGIYRAEPVNFNMAGYWETTLHIVKAPIDDYVVINLCVQ